MTKYRVILSVVVEGEDEYEVGMAGGAILGRWLQDGSLLDDPEVRIHSEEVE